jgi:phosphate-selective porin OprO/OprP
VIFCLLGLVSQPVLADSSSLKNDGTESAAPLAPQAEPVALPSPSHDASQDPSQKKEDPPTLFRGYWKQGLILEHPKKRFKIKIGGKFMVDGGYRDAGSDLQAAFPELDGWTADFRIASLALSGNLWKQRIDFKFEIDFAHVQDIKDDWIRFPTVPVLKHLVFGHITQPFSLEELSSLNYLTFMERGLPNEPFSPGRDIGIMAGNLLKKEGRLTWRLGAFLNTGSLRRVGDARNQIERANGYDVSLRVTGLPVYRNEGKHLLHLGFSGNYRNRATSTSDPVVLFRARPETRLTDTRLISTGPIEANSAVIVAPELAIVSGPFSLQGEVFSAHVNADDPLTFWGGYLYGSVFLTGEHRIYNPLNGTFSRVTPFRLFEPLKGKGFGGGALELGVRYSTVDLNDRDVRGGEEANLTTGLNWYIRSNLRLMVNYIHVRVKDRAEPPIDDDTAHILQARFQVHF